MYGTLCNKHVESKRNDFTCGGHMWGQEQKSDCLAHFHYIPWNDGVSLDAVPSCCLACKWCATVFSLSVLIASTVSVFYLTGSSPSPGFSVLVNDNHCLHQRVSCPLISKSLTSISCIFLDHLHANSYVSFISIAGYESYTGCWVWFFHFKSIGLMCS